MKLSVLRTEPQQKRPRAAVLATACLNQGDRDSWRALATDSLRALARGKDADAPSSEGETALILAEASARMGNCTMAETALLLGAYLAPELIRMIRAGRTGQQLSDRRSILCAPDSWLRAAVFTPNVDTLMAERGGTEKDGKVTSLFAPPANPFLRNCLLRGLGVQVEEA